jgi:hypothetical protein
MAKKTKSKIFRFSMKNSHKIFETGKSADFDHPYVKTLKLVGSKSFLMKCLI